MAQHSGQRRSLFGRQVFGHRQGRLIVVALGEFGGDACGEAVSGGKESGGRLHFGALSLAEEN